MVVDGYEMTESHSEAEIYRGCIALMRELMHRFGNISDRAFLARPQPLNPFSIFQCAECVIGHVFPLHLDIKIVYLRGNSLLQIDYTARPATRSLLRYSVIKGKRAI